MADVGSVLPRLRVLRAQSAREAAGPGGRRVLQQRASRPERKENGVNLGPEGEWRNDKADCNDFSRNVEAEIMLQRSEGSYPRSGEFEKTCDCMGCDKWELDQQLNMELERVKALPPL